MNDKQNHDDRIDARLEALLDAALAPDSPPAGLSDRIVAATAARLHARAHRGVLARIGPALMGLAAALVFALGGSLYVARVQQEQSSPSMTPITVAVAQPAPVYRVTPIESPRGTEIDTRITMLALQVELADSRDLWASPGEAMEVDAMSAELEALTDPVMFF